MKKVKAKVLKYMISENEVIRVVNDYLQVQKNQRKLMFIRNNSGAFPIDDGINERRYIRFGDKGSPDFLIWKSGRYYRGMNQDDYTTTKKYLRSIAIEAKSDIGKQSKEQKEWQADFEAIGGEYYIVRSIEEAINKIEGR